ncbi:DNA-binding response regulator [filamentous cyanobacterium CCP1]|nr:DNA-binding response regulator [filamentous cyanobacterium CCP2]PSB66221.1 DNA-binding response regulator [filamentous cyanobacterium CCP1]
MSKPGAEISDAVYHLRNILVLENDDRLRESIVQLLQGEQYQVMSAVDGNTGLQMALQTAQHRMDGESINLIILDQTLPHIDGLTICQRLRQMGSNVPILMISSKTSETDRVVGLELGADDYLPKPFGMRELLARCRALLRRWDSQPDRRGLLRIGDIVLDHQSMAVHVRGQEVSLSPREFRLLKFFMQHPRQVLSRELLVKQVWGQDFLKDPKTLDVHIRWLREKLEVDPSQPQYLITMRGFGYRFG